MDKENRFNFPFNVEEFRQDVINNLDFKEIKAKYGKIKTRLELEGYIHRLSQHDGSVYTYEFAPIIRGESVYEAKDGFIKISKRLVKQFKSELQCENLELGSVELANGKIIIEVKAA